MIKDKFKCRETQNTVHIVLKKQVVQEIIRIPYIPDFNIAQNKTTNQAFTCDVLHCFNLFILYCDYKHDTR